MMPATDSKTDYYASQLVNCEILVPLDDRQKEFGSTITTDNSERVYCVNKDFQVLLSAMQCANPDDSIFKAVDYWLDMHDQQVSDLDMRHITLIVKQILHIIAFKGME